MQFLILALSLLLFTGTGHAIDSVGPPSFVGATLTSPVINGAAVDSGSSAPSLSSGCGTGATIIGTDDAFQITVGTGPASPCIATFTTGWATNSWCLAKNNTSDVRDVTAPTTAGTSVSLTGTVNASDKIAVTCGGN